MILNKRKGESYQHAAARTVFKSWLDEASKTELTAKFGPFEWKGNVFEEFAFIKEISEPVQIMDYNLALSSYEELVVKGIKPVAIADLAIVHKGMVAYAIEIVHKHDLDQPKISRLLNLKSCIELEIWRIEAHWVLSQVNVPTEFPFSFIRRMMFVR